MKKFSKILSVALLVALVLSLGATSAFAQTITINRDSSWKATADLEEGESNVATYTWYKLFDASISESASVNVADGTSSGGVAVYTISGTDAANKVNVLDTTVFNADLASDGKYYITVKDGVTDSTVIAALKTMMSVAANKALFESASVTSDKNPVKIENLTPGYYFIEASNGKDVIVQTLDDVTVNEKNDYPTIDKKQKKANGTYGDVALPAEIGTYIDYQVVVHVPADANKPIAVVDKMSDGLAFDVPTGTDGLTVTYAEGVTVKGYTAMTSTDAEYEAGATWQIKFPTNVVEDNQGKDIVITYRALVTEAALVDTGRENEVTLKYDNNHYILKDKVDFDIGAAAIVKYDGATADLNTTTKVLTAKTGKTIAYVEATFALTAGEGANKVDVNVTKVSDGVYKVDPSSSSNLVTSNKAKDGLILIYGLDPDGVTYTLTETATETGFNMMSDTVPLTVVKAEKSDVNTIKVVVDGISGVSAGNSAADGEHTLTLTADQVNKVANNKGTVLPSTGGIGTTIFYVVGGVLVLAAIILLVTKKRMSE